METDQSLVNYINANIHSGDSNQNYELREINQHWFANDANFQMFNAYIVHSLVNHWPILIGYPYFRSGIRAAHAILITGITIDPNDINNTEYTLMDPNQTETRTILANDFFEKINIEDEPLSVIGAISGFNFNNKTELVNIPEEDYNGNTKSSAILASNEKLGFSFGIDLTQTAGILNTAQLSANNGQIVFDHSKINQTWDDLSKTQNIDYFNINKIKGNQPWNQGDSYLYYDKTYGLANCTAWWWVSTHAYNNYNHTGDLCVDFQYQTRVVRSLTGESYYLSASSGNSLIIYYTSEPYYW